MPTTLTTSSWLFPPRTERGPARRGLVVRRVRSKKNCDPADPADDHKGDWWDHVAYDAGAQAGPGRWSPVRASASVPRRSSSEVKDRLGDRPPALFTSDEHAAYETAIADDLQRGRSRRRGPAEPRPPAGGRPGGDRRPDWPTRRCARSGRRAGWCRSAGRWSWGTRRAVEEVLKASVCSRTINTSFVERRHATDRGSERAEVAADVPVQQGLAGARGDDLLHGVSLQLLLVGADAADQGGGWPPENAFEFKLYQVRLSCVWLGRCDRWNGLVHRRCRRNALTDPVQSLPLAR